MDLEQYKESWKKQPEEINKVSQIDIYKMTLKKSSSIVKWIFIIGIAEFIFWIIISIIGQTEQYKQLIKAYNIETIMNAYTIVHFIIILLFLYGFYKSYRSISIAENTKQLLDKILKTRKIVKNYVNYNIFNFIIGSIILYLYFYSDKDLLLNIITDGMTVPDKETFWIITIIVQVIVLLFVLVLLWLFYKLIYFRLLKKLTINYKELVKLEE